MSLNNQLVICKKKNKYEVHENLCVDNDFKCNKNNLLKSFNSLQKGIRYANEYCNSYPGVEYGYYIEENALK